MSVRFQVTADGLNGVTKQAWRDARNELTRGAKRQFGNKFLDVTSDFTFSGTQGNRVVALNGFRVKILPLGCLLGDVPEEVKVKAVNIYGEDMSYPVPVQVVERHVF